MGNKFDQQAQNFGQSERYTIMIPSELQRLIQDKLKTPYAIFKFFRGFLADDAVKFTYSMNKKQFVLLCEKHLKIDRVSDSFDLVAMNTPNFSRKSISGPAILHQNAKESILVAIFDIFAVRPPQAMTGKQHKMVNVLEFLAALILLADFGESCSDDLQHNAELIEHKVNLMIIMFDLNLQSKMNIVEVIIMLRTSLQALSKVFPTVSFFKNNTVYNEIKETMMKVFRDKLEQGVSEMYGLSGDLDPNKQKDFHEVDTKEGSSFLGFMSAQKQGALGASNSQPSFLNDSLTTDASSDQEDSARQMYVPKGISALQRHIHESLAEKKRRLFKWNDYEKVMLTLDIIKDQLLQCNNVIKFMSLFNSFNMVTLVWGSNRNLNLGLHIQNNYEQFYELESGREIASGKSDKAIRDLVNLSKKQAKDNDDLLVFQTLLQKWQDELSVQRSSTEDFQMTLMKQKRSYARVNKYKSPTIMMSMLNTHTADIHANSRMTLVRNPDGTIYCLGKDFREKKEDQDDRQYGVPRVLKLPQAVKELALGKDHALLLTEDSNLYAFGSNQYGQLGIETAKFGEQSRGSMMGAANQTMRSDVSIEQVMSAEMQDSMKYLQEYEHPITCESVKFAAQPVPVVLSQSASDQIKQIAAGDHHNVILTLRGEIYAWGLAQSGQLGVQRGKSYINTLAQKNGIQFAPSPLKVTDLRGKVVNRIIAKRNCTFAFTDQDRIYSWGHMPKGINFKSNDEMLDAPTRNKDLEGFNFHEICFSQDSAVGIARSIVLNFEIPESEESDMESARQYMKNNQPSKIHKNQTQRVAVHAIPIYDGLLISSEADIVENLIEFGEMAVELLNDFEVPWICKKNAQYPKYRKIKRKKRGGEEGEEAEEEEDDQSDYDDRGGETNEEEEDDETQRLSDESLHESEKEASESEENKEEDDAKRKRTLRKRKKKEMSEKEKQTVATKQFLNRLPNKKYFKHFVNRTDGIPEAEARDEETTTVNESVLDDRSDNRKKTKKKQDRVATGPDGEDDKDEDDDEEGEDGSGSGEGDGDEDDDGDDDDGDEDSDDGDIDVDSESLDVTSGEGGNDGENPQAGNNAINFDLEAIFMNANGILVDERQLKQEREYVMPAESENKSKLKINMLKVRTKFDLAQALLVNFLADDYRFLLKKLIGLVSIIPPTLKLLICPLPKGATHVDQFFAKRIQQMVSAVPDLSMQIVFVTHEAHKQLIRNFYRVGKDTVKAVNSIINVSANFSESTLLYSWGSAAFGKLGIGLSTEKDCENASEFVKEDLGRTKFNYDDPDVYQHFTCSPQPIVSFLGMKVKSIQAGLHHFLALTTLGELYSWGDNSHCQLGQDDPDALFPPNTFDKEPVWITTQEKPDSKEGSNKHEKSVTILQTSRTSAHAVSQMTESGYDGYEETTHEVMWELEERVNDKTQQPSTGPPKIEFNQITRQAQKSRTSGPQSTWKRVLKFTKVPYKVHTDRQSAFGPTSPDYKDGAKKQAAINSQIQESMLNNTLNGNTYQVLGIAKLLQPPRENKYELVICGDYNSYAIVNI